MIQVYVYYPVLGLPNASPFCLKIETFLRMVKLPFELVYTNNPRLSPTNKLPFIKDENITIPDSRFIIKYLIEKYNLTVDDHLTEAEHAKGMAITRLLEDSLYWAAVYSRWIDERFWPLTKKHYFSRLKMPLRAFLPGLIRKDQKKVLWSQGITRLSRAQIYELAEEDIRAISNLLGDQPYILGSKVSSFDAAAYGFIANIVVPEIPTPLKTYASQHSNLEAYCARIKQQFY